MKLYMVRHGETDRNKENRVLGRSDFPLNEAGLKQAAAAGEGLKEIVFDAVYSSPMKRALQTAEGIMEHSAHPVSIVPEDALIEQDFGIFEGVPRDDETYQSEKHLYFKPFEDGESFLDVAARVYRFLDHLKETPQAQGNILLVTHGGICRVIENYFHGMNNEDFASYFMKNCEIRSFDFPGPGRGELKILPAEEA